MVKLNQIPDQKQANSLHLLTTISNLDDFTPNEKLALLFIPHYPVVNRNDTQYFEVPTLGLSAQSGIREVSIRHAFKKLCQQDQAQIRRKRKDNGTVQKVVFLVKCNYIEEIKNRQVEDNLCQQPNENRRVEKEKYNTNTEKSNQQVEKRRVVEGEEPQKNQPEIENKATNPNSLSSANTYILSHRLSNRVDNNNIEVPKRKKETQNAGDLAGHQLAMMQKQNDQVAEEKKKKKTERRTSKIQYEGCPRPVDLKRDNVAFSELYNFHYKKRFNENFKPFNRNREKYYGIYQDLIDGKFHEVLHGEMNIKKDNPDYRKHLMQLIDAVLREFPHERYAKESHLDYFIPENLHFKVKDIFRRYIRPEYEKKQQQISKAVAAQTAHQQQERKQLEELLHEKRSRAGKDRQSFNEMFEKVLQKYNEGTLEEINLENLNNKLRIERSSEVLKEGAKSFPEAKQAWELACNYNRNRSEAGQMQNRLFFLMQCIQLATASGNTDQQILAKFASIDYVHPDLSAEIKQLEEKLATFMNQNSDHESSQAAAQ